MSKENPPRDKKLEHSEDLERMSRILERRSEKAKVLENKEPDYPSPILSDTQGCKQEKG